jgi:hypothetical protein
MNRTDLWQRIAARRHAVRFAELETLLLAGGWRFEHAGKGDHLVYARGRARISIPYRRGTMLTTYVQQVLRLTEGEDDD